MTHIHHLLTNWEQTVEALEKGVPIDRDEYLNDLDGRRWLSVMTLDQQQAEKLAVLDKRFRSWTLETTVCMWGQENAEREGWNRQDQWWYWRRPHISSGNA